MYDISKLTHRERRVIILILPMTYPMITHKPPVANLLSVIGNSQSAKNWMFEKFFNIYINSEGKADFWGKSYYYRECPFVRVDSVPRELFINYKYDFVQICKELLSMEFYVSANINTRYISLYKTDYDFDHGIFIFGFDDVDGIFYVADFFKSKYRYDVCPYNELEKAFMDKFVDSTEYDESMFIFRKKQEKSVYNLNLDRVKLMVSSHLNSANLFDYFHQIPFEESLLKSVQTNLYSLTDLKREYSFGLNFYDAVDTLLKEENYYDVRALHLLYDRSKIVDELARNLVNSFNCFSFINNTSEYINRYIK